MKKSDALFKGVLATVMTVTLAGCGSPAPGPNYNSPPPSNVKGCKGQWEYDADDDEWECETSGGSRAYYYGGTSHTSSITKTPGYTKRSSISSSKSGLGSGSKGSSSTGG